MLSFNCFASDSNEQAKSGKAPLAAQGAPADLPADVKAFLLTLARQSLEACVNKKPAPKPDHVPEIVKPKQGCFVTLTIDGQLRGCIGYLEGIKPLYEAVIDNARSAALMDPRFSPVSPAELTAITIEISVLTMPQTLEYTDWQDLLKKITPGVDGVILKRGFHQSTFLPQVWEQLPDRIQFLQHLSLKGGMDPDGWKAASVKTYRAIHFQEHK